MSQRLSDRRLSVEYDSLVGAGRRSIQATRASSWVGLMQVEQEHYTAGASKQFVGSCAAILCTALITALYMLGFCRIDTTLFGGERIGRGDDFKRAIVDESNAQVPLITVLVWIVVYLFDVMSWEKNGRVLMCVKKVVTLSVTALTIAAILFTTERFNIAPFIAFSLLAFILVYQVKSLFFRDVDKLVFLKSLGIGFVLSGCFVMFVMLYSFYADGNDFSNRRTKLEYQASVNCPDVEANGTTFSIQDLLVDANYVQFVSSGGELEFCEDAFLLWMAPIVYFVCCIYFGCVLWFLHRAERERLALKKRVKMEPTAQLFVVFIVVFLISLIIASAVSASTTTFSAIVPKLAFIAVALTVAMAISVFGFYYFRSVFRKSALGQALNSLQSNEYAKAAGLFLLLPFAGLFLLVDFVKQQIRNRTFIGNYLTEEERSQMFTRPVSALIDEVHRWDFGQLIYKSFLVATALIMVSVGLPTFMMLFFSFMRESTLDMSVASSLTLIGTIGFVLNMLPKAPRIPFYILSGVTIPSIVQKHSGYSFMGGVFLAASFCLILKFVSLILQHRIGKTAGHRLWIKKAAKYNDDESKATMILLQDNELGSKQVAIMMGGPDWGTGVLAGMIGYPLRKLLLGSSTIFLRMLPLVFMGASAVESGLDPGETFYSTLNSVAVIFTIFLQLGPVIRYSKVVKVVENLERVADDEELHVLEKPRHEANKVFYEITEWKNFSKGWKRSHWASLCLTSACFYVVEIFNAEFFVTFDVTDSIVDDLSGNPFYIIKAEGWVFLCVYFSVVGYFVVFNKYFYSRAKYLAQSGASAEKDKEKVEPEDSLEEVLSV